MSNGALKALFFVRLTKKFGSIASHIWFITYRFETIFELLLELRSGSDRAEDDDDGMLGDTDRRWDWAEFGGAKLSSVSFLPEAKLKYLTTSLSTSRMYSFGSTQTKSGGPALQLGVLKEVLCH